MNGNCGWLEHGTLFIGNGWIKWYCVLLRDHYIICVTSVLSGTDEAVMFAEREVAILTVITFHTWDQRCTGYAVPHFYLRNTFAHFYYISGEFMSQYDGIKMHPIMQYTWNI